MLPQLLSIVSNMVVQYNMTTINKEYRRIYYSTSDGTDRVINIHCGYYNYRTFRSIGVTNNKQEYVCELPTAYTIP